MSAPTKRNVLAAAARLGVTDVQIREGDVDLWAPAGRVFNATGCHSLVASRWDDDTQADLYASILKDLAAGLSDCPGGPDCEGCA